MGMSPGAAVRAFLRAFRRPPFLRPAYLRPAFLRAPFLRPPFLRPAAFLRPAFLLVFRAAILPYHLSVERNPSAGFIRASDPSARFGDRPAALSRCVRHFPEGSWPMWDRASDVIRTTLPVKVAE